MADADTILAPIAPGELVDKITILEIKRVRITDEAKLQTVMREFAALELARDAAIDRCEQLDRLTGKLRDVNEQLWEIEDAIRICDRDGDFGPRFVELARAVYRTNDRRAALKREINELLGSTLVEEKQYADYGGCR